MAVVDVPPSMRWIPTSQAARRLDRSANTIRNLVAGGRLRAVQTPLGLLVDPGSIDELLRARSVTSPAEPASAAAG